MDNNKPFVVLQSKKKETEDAFITKLQRKSIVEDAFFGAKEKKETLYIKGSKEVPVGTEIPATHIVENYRVEEHLSEMPNEDGSVTRMMLKWLHLK